MWQALFTSLQNEKAAVRKLGIDMLMAALRSLSPESFSRRAAPHVKTVSLCMPARRSC